VSYGPALNAAVVLLSCYGNVPPERAARLVGVLLGTEVSVGWVDVVYVDYNPMVLAHARALLTSSPEGRTAYIQADLRDPGSILASPVLREVLDLGQPVALMLIAVLHFLPDEDEPGKVIAALLDALPPGSYLAASHTTAEHDRERWAHLEAGYRSGGIRGQLRDSGEFARLAFTGLQLVPPGVTLVSEWRPEDNGPRPTPVEVSIYGGVARKG